MVKLSIKESCRPPPNARVLLQRHFHQLRPASAASKAAIFEGPVSSNARLGAILGPEEILHSCRQLLSHTFQIFEPRLVVTPADTVDAISQVEVDFKDLLKRADTDVTT